MKSVSIIQSTAAVALFAFGIVAGPSSVRASSSWQDDFQSYSAGYDITTQPGWSLVQSGTILANSAKVDNLYPRENHYSDPAVGNNSLRLYSQVQGQSNYSRAGAALDIPTVATVTGNSANISFDWLFYYAMDQRTVISGRGFYFSVLSNTNALVGDLLVRDGARGINFTGDTSIPYPQPSPLDQMAWRHVDFGLDFVNHTISYSIDGTLLSTRPMYNAIGAADLGKLSLQKDYYYPAASVDMDQWIDNVAITPEPATMGLLGLACLALLGKRQNAQGRARPCSSHA